MGQAHRSSQAIVDKETAKAETETQLQSDIDSKKSTTVEAMETAKYLGGLHQECDWKPFFKRSMASHVC